jgi:Zn-finger nucleic acid-binding protein
MKSCPVCNIQFSQTLLDRNLPAYKCSNCSGLWISSNEYLTWLSTTSTLPDDGAHIDQDFDTPYPIADNNQALLCPDCGRFLRRYQIWPNSNFYLDRCSTCNGIWFDRNEWQTLQTQNLHKDINVFFTHAWQEKLKSKEMEKRFKGMYLELFGEDDYQKVQDIRQWLYDHPNGNRLLAYLADREPYKG